MSSSASADREKQVLDLWERGVGLDRWRREDALLAAGQAPPRGLGARNAALLGMRSTLFDRQWPLRSCCPACAAECAFEADSLTMAEELRGKAAEGTVTFDWAGHSTAVRAPTADDLQAISRQPDHASAVRALLARCLTGDVDLAHAGDGEIAELNQHLERLDPGAIVGFSLNCPACGHEWTAMLDVGEALWSELQRAAERSFIEIDALARAYGWTEQDILRLSPARRAAYLQLVEGS